MPLVAAYDDVKDNITKRVGGADRPSATNITYFSASPEIPDAPTAFLALYAPGSNSSTHFHEVDQFQIIVDGKGVFGRHTVSPYCAHFSRAYTPYGPLHADNQMGWTFLTLRTRYDAGGAQRLPGSQAKLTQIPDRHPWQVTKKIDFPAQNSGVSVHSIAEIKDDRGLFVCSLIMPSNSRVAAPDPSGGDGQFVVVLKGSLNCFNKEYKALTVVFIKPGEGAFEIHAGDRGMEGLILNFPQVRPYAAAKPAPLQGSGFGQWQCALCGFTYDEARGIPEEGIAAGTRWKDVPDTWSCPDCAAGKSDFLMIAV